MVVVAAVVLGFVLLGGADSLPIIGGSPPPPTPDFAFTMTKVTPVATSSESTHKDLETKAKEAAGQVTDQMNTLYIGAFLDPGNWLDGSYDSVWELFDQGASAEAQTQVETLTAGTGAGDTFKQILPDAGKLKAKVLFDLKDQPYSVVAITTVRGGWQRHGRSGREDDQPRPVRVPAGGRGLARRVVQGAPRQRGAGAEPVAERDPHGEPIVTGRRRGVFAVIALAAWVAGSALGSIGAVAPASAQSAGLVIGKAHAGYAPSLTGNKPIVLLVVGSGARLGDDIQHSLADSIHVVSINPDKHKATIIGIPRDSWVDIPGHGTNKINASLVEGGPDLLIQTVESISGLKIDYYALTTFWGLDAVVRQPRRSHDRRPVPDAGFLLRRRLRAWCADDGRQAGARVLPRPAQRQQR